MKQIYLLTITFLICNFGFTANAQSVTVTKILHYLKNQQQTTINTDLIRIGFTFNNKKEIPNLLEYSYYKEGNNFTEKINIVSNDEIFSVVYGPEKSYFTTMKEIMLTKQLYTCILIKTINIMKIQI